MYSIIHDFVLCVGWISLSFGVGWITDQMYPGKFNYGFLGFMFGVPFSAIAILVLYLSLRTV